MIVHFKTKDKDVAEEMVFRLLYNRLEFGYVNNPKDVFPIEALVRRIHQKSIFPLDLDFHVDIPDEELALWFKMRF